MSWLSNECGIGTGLKCLKPLQFKNLTWTKNYFLNEHIFCLDNEAGFRGCDQMGLA